MRYVSEIFNETPGTWGLRGDPLFWDDLKRHFGNVALPYPAQALGEEIKTFFRGVSGESLTRDINVYVEKYALGGMSSGMVSGSYWIEQAIPLLMERLNKANKSDLDKAHVFEYEKRTRTSGIAMIATGIVLLIVAVVAMLLNPFSSPLLYILLSVLFAAICFPLIGYGIRQFNLHTISIRIISGCIEYKRGGKVFAFPFREIEDVHISSYLKLGTKQGAIRIEKNIKGYQQLYDLLAGNIAKLNEAPESPVIMRSSPWSAYVLPVFGVLVFSGLTVYSVSRYLSGGIPLFAMVFMGGLGVFFTAFILYFALTMPNKYLLDEEGIAACSLIKTKLHPRHTIKSVQYGQITEVRNTRYRSRMVNYIQFYFTDGSSVTIDERFTSYPIELARRFVQKKYGVKPVAKHLSKA